LKGTGLIQINEKLPLPYLDVVRPVQFLPTVVLGCYCDQAFKSPRKTKCSAASCVSTSSVNTPGFSRADSGNAHRAVRCWIALYCLYELPEVHTGHRSLVLFVGCVEGYIAHIGVNLHSHFRWP